MGLYTELDRMLGGLLPGGALPFWKNEPSEMSGATLQEMAETGRAPAGAAPFGRGPVVSMVGNMTAAGFVPRKLMKGSPIMTTSELSLLKRARRVGRDLGHALGLHSKYSKAVRHGR